MKDRAGRVGVAISDCGKEVGGLGQGRCPNGSLWQVDEGCHGSTCVSERHQRPAVHDTRYGASLGTPPKAGSDLCWIHSEELNPDESCKWH